MEKLESRIYADVSGSVQFPRQSAIPLWLRRRMNFPGIVIAALLTAATGWAQATPSAVIVASKPFGESYLLAEMFAQLLEARGIRVDRRPGLGATELAFRALRTGAIDVYPEYTGTGLLVLLGEPPRGTASDV